MYESFTFSNMLKLKIFWGLLIIMSFTSCATIVNKNNYNANIYSNLDNAQVQIKDSIYKLPATIPLERSKEPLEVILSDTSNFKKVYTLKPRFGLDVAYGNMMLLVYVAPLGYFIDRKTQKGFYYGRYIFLDKNDSLDIYRPPVIKSFPSKQAREYFTKSFPIQKQTPQQYFAKSFPTHKGLFRWKIALPYINSFYLKPQNEPIKDNTGFWGIATGLEYFYKDKKFLSVSINAASDLFVPVPASPGFDGEYESMSSAYLSLNDNFKIKRFSLGYGLNYSFNTWTLNNTDFDPSLPPSASSMREPVRKVSESIGFNVNVYHQFGKSFFMGIIYRPTFLKVYPETKLEYEHLISFEFAWRIKLNPKSSKDNND